MTEKDIKKKCHPYNKSRTVMYDEYKLEDYLRETNIREAKYILKMRLHMMDIPCNFTSGKQTQCWLCGKSGANEEHYFRC